MTIIRIGLDTSKHLFQIHGVDETETPVLRRQVRRGEVEKFFAKLPPTRIGIEACGASHHWARVLQRLGHEVLLMPPQHVKPYAQRGKNDAIDAAAICEAMSRPTMRFVPIKTAEQQAALSMLGTRDLLIKQRTMLINAIRGHAAEFGVTAAKGPRQVPELLRRVAAEESVPRLAHEMLGMLAGQLEGLDAKLKAIEARLMAWHRQDQVSQCLATIPGVGPIGAVSFALKVPAPKNFRSARHFAAWIGITPRENSTAGKPRLGKISRQGDENLRRLLVLGATAVIGAANPRGHTQGPRGNPRGNPKANGASLYMAPRIAGGQAQEARGGRAGQQDGPHHLGHDGERRDLPASQAGLSPPATDTWHRQGQQQKDGNRSIRGSGQPGEPSGAWTSRSCLGPDPRNPSGPAVKPTAQQRPDI